jgi:hypothetical protein
MSAIVRAFGLLVSIIFLSSLVANSAQAQIARGAVRTMGILPGSGYHVKESLTDSSYYQPYSEVNSQLLTSPEVPRIHGLATPGTWNAHNLEVGTYPGNLHSVSRASTPRWFRWNSPTRGW